MPPRKKGTKRPTRKPTRKRMAAQPLNAIARPLEILPDAMRLVRKRPSEPAAWSVSNRLEGEDCQGISSITSGIEAEAIPVGDNARVFIPQCRPVMKP